MAATVTGLEQLKRNVAALRDHVELRAALRATEAGARVFQLGMSQRAPRDTGKLSAGIVVEIVLDKGGYVARIGPDRHAFYGQFLEFGTRYRAAYPFVRPTLDEEAIRARQVMDHTFRDSIERYASGLRV